MYKRHGAGDNLFGVSFKDLRSLAKKYRDNLDLAGDLFDTGNADARCLALLITPPSSVSIKTLTNWRKAINYYLHADLLAQLAADSPHGEKLMKSWIEEDEEFARATGYAIMTCLLKDGKLKDQTFVKAELTKIESGIHNQANRVKHSMNMAVIAMGIYLPELDEAVRSSARKIGKVTVDHGETGCKTPEIIPYINKAITRSKKKKGSGS